MTSKEATADRGSAFEDVSREMGIAARRVGPRSYGPLWADLDGNGWLDLVFVNHVGGLPPSVYLNHGGQRFAEYFDRSGIAQTSGYLQSADRHGASAADYDNDGAVDLIFSRGAARGETLGIKYDQLLRNRGDATFEEVPPTAGAANAHGRARTPTWVDFDRDGWLDLYVGNYVSANRLLRNVGGERFADLTERSGLGLVEGSGQAWCDYDLDGWPDVMTVSPPRLFRNQGDGRFSDVSSGTNLAAISLERQLKPLAVAWGDFDGDGRTDVFLTSYGPGRNTLLRNEGAVFSAVPGDFGSERGETAAGASWGDVDNDGDLDLVVLGSRTFRLFENTGGELRPTADLGAGLELGVDADVAFADYDNDGRLDLALQTPADNLLLRNVGESGSWLEIRFHGTTSNRQALGAKVWAQAGPRRLFREHWGDMGVFHSSSAAPLHLGLGHEENVGLTVQWPAGKRQLFRALPARRIVLLYEGRT